MSFAIMYSLRQQIYGHWRRSPTKKPLRADIEHRLHNWYRVSNQHNVVGIKQTTDKMEAQIVIKTSMLGYMRIFAGVLWKGSVKRHSKKRSSIFLVLSMSLSSEALEVRQTLLYGIPSLSFHWPQNRWPQMILSDVDHFALFADEYTLFLSRHVPSCICIIKLS